MRLRGGRELTPDPYLELVPPPPSVAWLSGVLRKGVRLRLRLNHGDGDRGRSFWQLVDLAAEPPRAGPPQSKCKCFFSGVVLQRSGPPPVGRFFIFHADSPSCMNPAVCCKFVPVCAQAVVVYLPRPRAESLLAITHLLCIQFLRHTYIWRTVCLCL